MITTLLFDFDGVIADTEPLYDLFWNQTAQEYGITIPNFSNTIKGVTLKRIFEIHFANQPQEEIDRITNNSSAYELQMNFQEIAGARQLLQTLKAKGYKLGLVTSSGIKKMNVALPALQLEGIFDTIITAESITQGKPDPMCYLLAAQQLGSRPEECVVLEDSFSGIQSGTAAGMRVIGLSTTNAAERISDKVFAVIPDLSDTIRILSLL